MTFSIVFSAWAFAQLRETSLASARYENAPVVLAAKAGDDVLPLWSVERGAE